MLNLYIVEDEQPTREGLLTMMDWESLGIRVCGQAENGMEALPALESGIVDVLLTDIRMPLLDGLQLIAEIQHRELDIACILMSGYNDFEYAQRAIRLGAYDYLIKPCSPRQVADTFRGVVRQIIEKRRMASDLDGLQLQLQQNLSIAKSQLLLQWLHSPKKPAENRREKMIQLNMATVFQHVVVILIRPDRKPLRKLNYKYSDLELLRFAATNIVKETLEQTLLQSVETVNDQNEIIVICNGTHEFLLEKLKNGLEQLQINLKKFLKITVSIGISDPQQDMDSLHEAYRESVNTLHMMFYMGAGQIFFARDFLHLKHPPAESVNESDWIRLEQSIIDNFRSGLYAEALNDTEAWLEFFQEQPTHSRTKINMQTLSLMTRLMGLAHEQGIAYHEWPGSMSGMVERIELLETLEELSAMVLKTIQQLVGILNPHKVPRRKIQQAIDFIVEHYNSPDLSLAGVAKELFISSTYLSTLFKQELGTNFLDYVHQYRIEKAKAMLQSGDCKIQTVARELGYFDEAHFTRTFKKWAGILPSQYKKEAAHLIDLPKSSD